MEMDAVSLAQTLVRFDTTNPPGRELECLEYLAAIFKTAGFLVRLDAFAPGRASLVAELGLGEAAPVLCLGGHIDTVCLGDAEWSRDPFAGDILDGRLYGRGASDMKSGVAALTSAALALAPALRARRRNLLVHVYGGEEAGCQGSFHLMEDPALRGDPAGLIIAEPSHNRILSGHKGALWLEVTANGRAAHGSMPEQGENALVKALRGAEALGELDLVELGAAHPHLGPATLSLTGMQAGHNVNAIPDRAAFTVDVRTVPEFDSRRAMTCVRRALGGDFRIRTLLDLPPVWTDPATPWVVRAKSLLAARTGREQPVATVQFFTDAAAFRSVLPELPVIILGPGDPDLAHQTDEYCPVAQIAQARELYLDIAADWYGLDRRELGAPAASGTAPSAA